MSRKVRERIKLYDVIEVGKVYSTHRYGDYLVLKKTKSNWFLVEFINTGYKVEKQSTSLKYGEIKDKLFPSVCNVGYIGDGEYPSKINGVPTLEYNTWRGMIDRCYNPNNDSYRFYGGNGVTVDKRWHDFQNFYKDIPYLENYDKWINKENGYEWTIDKDLKQANVKNKIYSKDTCLFLSIQEQIETSVSFKVTAFVNGIKLKDFKSALSASDEMNTFTHHIIDCCKFKIPSAGKYNEFPIVWRFTSDSYDDVEYKNKWFAPVDGYVNGIKIFEFDTIRDACKFTSASESGVLQCCRGNYKYSGYYNGDKIIWRFKNEDLYKYGDIDVKTNRFNGYIDDVLYFKNITIIEAKNIINHTKSSAIYCCCRGKVKHAGKYNNKKIRWEFAKEGESI